MPQTSSQQMFLKNPGFLYIEYGGILYKSKKEVPEMVTINNQDCTALWESIDTTSVESTFINEALQNQPEYMLSFKTGKVQFAPFLSSLGQTMFPQLFSSFYNRPVFTCFMTTVLQCFTTTEVFDIMKRIFSDRNLYRREIFLKS